MHQADHQAVDRSLQPCPAAVGNHIRNRQLAVAGSPAVGSLVEVDHQDHLGIRRVGFLQI